MSIAMAAAAPKECSEQCEKDKEIKKFKNLRRGKKSNITKRIAEIRKLVLAKESRTWIEGLTKLLTKAFEGAKENNDRVLELTEYAIEDTEWINDIEIAVDNCRIEVDEYLESRKDDAPSSAASRTKEWAEKSEVFIEDIISEADSDVTRLTATLQNMSTSESTGFRNNVSSTPVPHSLQHSPRPIYTPSALPTGSERFPPAFSMWREPHMIGPTEETEETSNLIGGLSINSLTKGPLFKLFPPSHGGSILSYKSSYPSGIDLPTKGTESAPETVRHGQGPDQIFPTDVQQEYAEDVGRKEVRHDNYQKRSVRSRLQQESDHSNHKHGYNQHSYGRSMSQDGHNQHQHGQSLNKPGQNQRRYDQNQYQKSPSQQLQHDQNHHQHDQYQQQHGHGQHQHGISQHQHGNDKHQHGLDLHQHDQLQHQHSQFQHQYGHGQHKYDQDRQQHDQFQSQHSRNQHGQDQFQHNQDQDQNNWDQFQHDQNPYENGQEAHKGHLDPQDQVLYQLPGQPTKRQSQPGFHLDILGLSGVDI